MPSDLEQTYQEARVMGPVIIGIAVVICAAFLLWQLLEADLAEDSFAEDR